MALLSPIARERIKKFKPVTNIHDPWVLGYRTRGGSYIIATNGRQDDNQKPNDLAIVSPYGIVTALKPSVNPELIVELQEVFTR